MNASIILNIKSLTKVVYNYFVITCLLLSFFPISATADNNDLLSNKTLPLDSERSTRILLLPRYKATLSSQINAKLVRFPFELGQRFKKDARLAKFDCDILRQELNKANAELEIVQAKHSSNKKMKEYQSISELEIAVSAAEVKKAKAEVGIVNARNRYCSIRAPYAGIIVKKHVNLSENVSKGQTIVDIISYGKPRVQMFIPSSWSKWLKSDYNFTIKIDETNKDYKAKVLRVVGQINPVSQTIEVEAEVTSESSQLFSGMSGTAYFSDKK